MSKCNFPLFLWLPITLPGFSFPSLPGLPIVIPAIPFPPSCPLD